MPSNKRNRHKVVVTGIDEVATDYKLQQFLEDVQKFTEKSKNNNEKQKKEKKSSDDRKQLCLKRGLFENGFRSKPCLKENRARLKSNLNDLVKECAITEENEEESSKDSSCSQSTVEGSYKLKHPEVENLVSHENEKADESVRLDMTLRRDFFKSIDIILDKDHMSMRIVRLSAVEVPHKTPDSSSIVIEDRNQLKELVWEKYCERMKSTQSIINIFPVRDHFKTAKKRINTIIYQTFLKNARRHPSVLKRIFSNDEIKRLAEVVVKEKVDKYVQTDFPASDSINNNIHCEMQTKKDSTQSFSHSSQNSCNNHKEEHNFFDLYRPNNTNTRVNFLESLENQAAIYSPTVQNTSPNCYVTPAASPLPLNIQECWAPSTLSTPRKPDIFSPNISERQSSLLKPSMSPPESFIINQPNLMRKKRIRRKKTNESLFKQTVNTLDSPLQLNFPKRKKVTFSPHRL